MMRRKRMLQDLDQDIRDHLDREMQDNIDRGMPPKEARYAALRKFGNVAIIKENTWEVWSVVWLEQLVQDARFGLRTLWRSPGLTLAAVLAIALGIGVNVGVFSVLNGVALRPLPISGADQIVSVNQVFRGRFTRNAHNGGNRFSYAEYLNYRDHGHVFSGLIAYEPAIEATLAGETAGNSDRGNVQQLLGTVASCNYFQVLNEHPSQGRGFVDSDCSGSGENAIVVVSHELWRGRFAGDPALVGKRIVLNRVAYTVVGIARPGFTGTEPITTSFWAPITMQKALEPGIDLLADDNVSWLALLGRAKDGVSMEQVRSDLGVIAGRIDRFHPGRTTTLVIHRATFFSSPEEQEVLLPAASVVLAAFALVLLMACANVANLLLARASTRQREIALRLSIGASRWRLMRQMLTESLLLSLGGGLPGSAIAFWSCKEIIQLVLSHLPHDVPAINLNVAPDVHVLAYALLLTLLTGIAFGLIPAWQSSRLDLNTAMKADGASGSGKRSRRLLLNTLVGSQVAVCMVLLLAAGLLLRGYYYSQTVDPGFEEKNVAQVFLDLRTQGYDENRATAFITLLRNRIRSFPGVIDVAQAECAPLSHDFNVDHFSTSGRLDPISVEYNHVSSNYFSLVGIPIVRGRGFTSLETRVTQSIIVSESTARRLWPGENPLGKTLRESAAGQVYSVIGVAKDAQVSHLGELNTSYLYFPFGPVDDARTYVLVRFAQGFTDTANRLRAASQSLDPNVSVNVSRLEDNLEVWRAPSRIVAVLSATLGTLALLLASIGIYGMVSYSVSRSMHETGIRVALGANGRDVMTHVLWQAMRPVLIGALAGVAVCAVVSGVLSGMMFGLSTHDPIAFFSVPVFLMAVALFASFIPARRATRVDPMMALRCE